MILSLLIIFIIGIIAGGLVNMLSDDLPAYRWPRRPHYPDGSPRPVSAWLGISAFLAGKRTAPDGSKLSWRYPLTELATVILMLLAYVAKHDAEDVTNLQMIFYLIYIPILVLVTVIDLEHRLILFAVMIPSAILAVVDAILTPINHAPSLSESLIGGGVGFAIFFLMYLGGIVYVYLINQLTTRNLKEVAFGYGDVMLAGVSGLMLGPGALLLALFMTVVFGALGSLLYVFSRVFSGKGYSLFTPLPYGPYIVAGTFLMLIFGQEMRLLLVGY